MNLFYGLGSFSTWVLEDDSTLLSRDFYDGDGVNFYIDWKDGTSRMYVDIWEELIKDYDWDEQAWGG